MLRGFLLSRLMRNRQFSMLIVGIIALFVSILYAQPLEEVRKFSYTGQPEDLNDTTIIVNELMVAMSEYIYVGTPTGAITKPVTPSIMFILDHSSSMYTNSNKDKWGNRFRVTRDLIDSLKTRFPKAEVGISVFTEYLYFRPEADPIFVQCPAEDSGAYIPLLKLDSSYSISNGEMGWEILQKWMETDTTIGTNEDPTLEFVDLIYRPNPMWPDWYAGTGSNTNINAGFEAAKHAFLSAKYPKNQQFIIFISDGARSPQTLPTDFVQGVNTPTTFTIYFIVPPEVLPQEIMDMNTNIQGNNYSTSNPSSELWEFQNSSYEALLTFLMTNVVEVIVQSQTSYPVQINVNGNIINPNPWDTSGFDFGRLFPLTGPVTPFVYDIGYKIWAIDSITPVGDTIWVYKDTSTHVEFNVEIQDGAPDLPDTFEVKSWQREIGFYYGGTQQTTVNETENPLELRFGYIDGDANYNYNNAEIEVVTTEGLAQDMETYTLLKSGNAFSGTFPLTIIDDGSSPTPGNGTIEHYVVDNLIATFRNSEDPKLPLDTIRSTVAFGLSGLIQIQCGYYFDNNANGFVDSIYVEATTDIASGLTDNHVQEILDSGILTLPVFRNFSINNSGVISGGFYIDVTEGNQYPTTYVTSDDKLTIREEILSMGGWVKDTIAPIYDRVAPIIHWDPKAAYLIDYQLDTISDTLGVKFSEPVENVTHEQPFYFLDVSPNPDTNYTVRLGIVGQPKPDSLVFYVIDHDPTYMEEGDSLWIHETNRVKDIVDNNQNNISNTRRMLYVERRMVPYDLNPYSISPIDINNINDPNFIIPQNIIDILINQNIINDLNLSQNSNGDYIGMIIVVSPDDLDFMLPDFRLKGDLTIYDAVGNQVVPMSKMGWDDTNKSLVWVWNAKNRNGRTVGAGMYLVLIEIQETTPSLYNSENGPKQVKRHFVGVKN